MSSDLFRIRLALIAYSTVAEIAKVTIIGIAITSAMLGAGLPYVLAFAAIVVPLLTISSTVAVVFLLDTLSPS